MFAAFRLNHLGRSLSTTALKMGRSAETSSFGEFMLITSGAYSFNHTMLRVKDPKKSLDFYQNVLGMEHIDTHKSETFTLYFLAFDHSNGSESMEEKKANRFAREGVLELTHNHGTENDPSFSYANGNEEPGRGFGHIAISVDDVEKACERFKSLGVEAKKWPEDGKMRHIAFIYDPDRYWVEIVPARR